MRDEASRRLGLDSDEAHQARLDREDREADYAPLDYRPREGDGRMGTGQAEGCDGPTIQPGSVAGEAPSASSLRAHLELLAEALTTPSVEEGTTAEQAEQAALLFAQEHGYSGDTLPKGERGRTGFCPLALATGLCVGYSTAARLDRGKALPILLPDRVAEFVRLFDYGLIGHLDLDQPEG